MSQILRCLKIASQTNSPIADCGFRIHRKTEVGCQRSEGEAPVGSATPWAFYFAIRNPQFLNNVRKGLFHAAEIKRSGYQDY